MVAAAPDAATSSGTSAGLPATTLPQHQTITNHTNSTNNNTGNDNGNTSASNAKNGANKSTSPNQSQTRLSNTTICLPIVYGSIAFPLPKTDEYNTHKWTLYVRGPNNEDLSQGIAKVVFQLHPSFAQPVRELTAPPFEVTEKGWGEFEASIRIVWRDPAEKALVLMHMIKLYPPIDKTTNSNSNVNGSVPGSGGGNSGSGTGVDDGSGDAKHGEKKEGQPVIHDFYDEVVFTDPTESFHAQLLGSGSESITRSIPKVESQEPSVQASFQPFSDGKDVHALLEAQKFIESELVAVKDRILRADWSKYELDSAISSVHAKAKAAAAANAPVVPAPAPVKRKSKGSGSSSKKAKTSSSSNSKSSS